MWLRTLKQRWFGRTRPFPSHLRRRAARQRSCIRPQLEALEERLTPVTPLPFSTAANAAQLVADIGVVNNNPSESYTITLAAGAPAGAFQLTGALEIKSMAGLTIAGNGNTLTAAAADRLFLIGSGKLTLQDLTLTGGAVKGTAESVAGGGAIYDGGGNLVLSDVVVENNSVQGASAMGGGIYASGGSLTIEGCTIQSNRAVGKMGAGGQAQGGGVFVTGSSTVQITDSVLSKNSATGGSGATGVMPGHAGSGGGLAQGGGLYVGGNGWHVMLTGDTLSGNKAIGGAGGNGAPGSSTPGTLNDNGGSAGLGGFATGGGAAFEIPSNNTLSDALTILNDPSHPSQFLDNSVQGGVGGVGGAGGGLPSPGQNANGGAGGAGGAVQGGGVAITNMGGNLTANIGNTTFYGNQAIGGSGGAGGVVGTGGSTGTGTAGSAGIGGASGGGGLVLALQAGNVTVANSTIAANNVLGGLDAGGSTRSTAIGGGIAIGIRNSVPFVTLDNDTITQNVISGGQIPSGRPTFGGGIGFLIETSTGSPPTTSGNLILFNNLIQGNRNGSAGDDFETIDFDTGTGQTSSGISLSNAVDNFLGAVTVSPVNTTNNIVGNNTPQLGNPVGVDAKGNATSGPIYYPLLPGVVSIGAGSTLVLSTIESVEGTPTATDEIGNPMPAAGPIDLGAVQVVSTSPATPPVSQTPPPSLLAPPTPPILHVPPLLAFFDSLLGGVETVNANGTETIVDSFFGIPLLVSTFDSAGNLASVLLFGINVTFLFA
jgi:hypothetical protein